MANFSKAGLISILILCFSIVTSCGEAKIGNAVAGGRILVPSGQVLTAREYILQFGRLRRMKVDGWSSPESIDEEFQFGMVELHAGNLEITVILGEPYQGGYVLGAGMHVRGAAKNHLTLWNDFRHYISQKYEWEE